MAKFNDFRDKYFEKFTVFAQIKNLGPLAQQLVNEFDWQMNEEGETYLNGLDAIRFLARFDTEIHRQDFLDDAIGETFVDEKKGRELFRNFSFGAYDDYSPLKVINSSFRGFSAEWFFVTPDFKNEAYKSEDKYQVMVKKKPFFKFIKKPFTSKETEFIINNLKAFNSESYLSTKEPVNSLGLVKNQLYFFSSTSIFQRNTSEGFPIEMMPKAVVAEVSRISGGPEIYGVNELGVPPLVAGVALTGEQIEQLMTKWPQANDTLIVLILMLILLIPS